MESVIGKAIDLVCEYTVVPIVGQLKYVFCYKSCVVEMNAAIYKLQNEKEIVDREKSAAENNGQLICKKAEDWLEAVTNTQEEVGGLLAYQETKSMTMSGCGRVGSGQIVNPIARHKLGRKATKKKQAIEELRRDRPRPDEVSYSLPPLGIVDSAEATASAAEHKIEGVFQSSRWEEIMEEIMTALKDNSTNIIGLHGMGGVGKSTIIKVVHDQVKKQCMFDEVAKVEVKVKPEIKRIQEEIAFALGLKFDNEPPAIRTDRLRERLLKTNKNQKKKTILIILDDLWEKLDLQEVGIPSYGNDQVHIKLLLTSRHEYLLSDKMESRNPIHLDVLNDTDALNMFKFFLGVGASGIDEKKVSQTATMCTGLPIVIEATAKALKNRAPDEWEKILKRLDNVDVLKKLEVSYDYLPSKESKELFLICGIVRGPRIQVRDLLNYTFGLGLYNRRDSSTLVAAAAKLEKLLSILEAASMLLKSDDPRYVKIHDRMRELAISIIDEDRLEWAYDVTLSDNSCELPDASELKLLLSGCIKGDVVELQDPFLKDMEKLNVLEFTNLRLRSLTTQIDHMKNLKMLCLHNCSLDDVSMIGGLKGLQILSFQGSDIRKLPIQLRELILLKMLDLSDCGKLTQIEPNVLGSLTKLEELNMENSFQNWEIEGGATSSNARLIELKNMSRLSNVRIHIPSSSILPKDGQLFSSKLTMYRIMFGVAQPKGRRKRVDTYRKLSDEYTKFSKVLMLTFDSSPDILWQDWVQTTLQTTEFLYLCGTLDRKCESMGDICIKGFECLKHLRLKNCQSFRFIISSNDNSSTNLESLFLENLESLENLCGELPRHDQAFNKLRFVNVTGCYKLTHLFDFSLLKSCLSSQLEEINVEMCTEIQCIFNGEGNDNHEAATFSNLQKLNFKRLPKFSSFCAGSSSNVLFTSKKVAFPCLESLKINQLDELEHIWHPTDPPTELGKLRLLHVDGCNKLVRVINSNVLMRLQQHLESLHIEECGLMKEVFDVDDAIISTDDEQHLVLFSKLKELYVADIGGLEGIHNYNKNVMMMMMMKSGRSMTIFPNIELLCVWRCDHLRYVLCCWLPTTNGVGVGYANLKIIEIGYCQEMEAIVEVMIVQETQLAATSTAPRDVTHHQNYDIVVSFSSLKQIQILECRQFRTFCRYLADDLPFFSQKEIFPRLESLHFEGLSKLGEIWPHEVPPQTSFNMLKVVTIICCPELSVVFPSTLIPRLDNLTDVNVQRCEKMRQIIIVVEEKTSKRRHDKHGGGGDSKSTVVEVEATMEMIFTFPCLTTLVLKDLLNLDRLYSSSSSSSSVCCFQFPSLETLQTFECKGVKTLFSDQRQATCLADGVDDDSDSDMQIGSLFTSCDRLVIPNLKSIELYGLEKMTKIWKGEKPQGIFLKMESLTLWNCSSSCTSLQSLLSVGVETSLSCWNVLTNLTVEDCDGLEYLLTPVGATSLVHLTHLSIAYCKNMKQVVAVEGEDDHIRDTVTFRHLKNIRLHDLPRLEKFSSVKNMVLNFPVLDVLDIERCPNMNTASKQIFGDLDSFRDNDRIQEVWKVSTYGDE